MTDPNESAAIRTPDQRLRVFVSSTLTELAEERVAVARAISALGLTPVMFELGARPQASAGAVPSLPGPIRHFHRPVPGERYGWIGPGKDISGLEDEFRLSRSIPRLLYVKTPAPEREARLTAMIGELDTQGTVSYRMFRSPRELGRLVRNDLAVLLSERFSAGDSGADRSPLPAASSGRRVPRSLPKATTSLFGRGHDIAEVSRLLETPGVRLVTLTGPGGIGKTRLAVAVGANLEDRYPQGVAFVPLASIASARAGSSPRRGRAGRVHRGHALTRRRRGRAHCGNAHPARAGQPRTGHRCWAGTRPAAGPLRGAQDAHHEPHRASVARRARVPGRSSYGANVRGSPANQGAGLVARGSAVRRSSPGRPPRLRPDRRQRARRGRDLPAARRPASCHRDRGRSRQTPDTRCITGSARRQPPGFGYRPGRSPRASAHVARDRRMEYRAARRRGAADAGHAVDLRRGLDGRGDRARLQSPRTKNTRFARCPRWAQPRQHRHDRRRAEVSHARIHTGAGRRASCRRRGPGRCRTSACRVPSCARGERRLAR